MRSTPHVNTSVQMWTGTPILIVLFTVGSVLLTIFIVLCLLCAKLRKFLHLDGDQEAGEEPEKIPLRPMPRELSAAGTATGVSFSTRKDISPSSSEDSLRSEISMPTIMGTFSQRSSSPTSHQSAPTLHPNHSDASSQQHQRLFYRRPSTDSILSMNPPAVLASSGMLSSRTPSPAPTIMTQYRRPSFADSFVTVGDVISGAAASTVAAAAAAATAASVYLSSDSSQLGEGSDEGCGLIRFVLAYDYQQKQLTVTLLEAVDLRSRDINGKSDPYVLLKLTPGGKRFEKKSKVISHSLQPTWNEKFIFDGFPPKYLLSHSLILQVKDHDVIGKDDLLGEVAVPLLVLHVNDLPPNPVVFEEMHKYLRLVQDPKKYVGDLLLSICYNSFDCKLTISIIRAKNLRVSAHTNLPHTYCTVTLKGNTGKILESHKTKIKPESLFPVWNEAFGLIVASKDLNHIAVDIKVCHKDRLGHTTIGKIRLCQHSKPQQAAHWSKAMNRQREIISQWHNLHK